MDSALVTRFSDRASDGSDLPATNLIGVLFPRAKTLIFPVQKQFLFFLFLVMLLPNCFNTVTSKKNIVGVISIFFITAEILQIKPMIVAFFSKLESQV